MLSWFISYPCIHKKARKQLEEVKAANKQQRLLLREALHELADARSRQATRQGHGDNI